MPGRKKKTEDRDIFLHKIWSLDNLKDYKVHFARKVHLAHGSEQLEPLEVYARNLEEWKGWQQTRPKKNDFNRPYIFSLARFYHEQDIWLFGGVFRVLERLPKRYSVELTDIARQFSGRLKLYSPHRGRGTRLNMENYYYDFKVTEILREPYSGQVFPGYGNINLPFDELETLIRNDRHDWRVALENTKGVYLITDTKTSQCYVGSAYGDDGIWSRWRAYIKNGHGGNRELRNIVKNKGPDYCRKYFRFALLEELRTGAPDKLVLDREAFWKSVLLTRGEHGLNRN